MYFNVISAGYDGIARTGRIWLVGELRVSSCAWDVLTEMDDVAKNCRKCDVL